MISIHIIRVTFFFLTFAIGYFFAAPFQNGADPTIALDLEPVCQPVVKDKNASELEIVDKHPMVEFTDLPNFGEIDFPAPDGNLIDTLEYGNIYRESEVIAKTGEIWLGLYEERGKSYLDKTKASVKTRRTINFPGDEFDTKLKFDHPGRPIFAVRNIATLKSGRVITLYHGPTTDEIDRRNLELTPLIDGYDRCFVLDDTVFNLRVTSGSTKDGTAVTVLVIESGDQSQVITYNGEGIIGDLVWAGDLDNDGNLDLYMDVYNEKGGFTSILYLSKNAGPDKLVKSVSIFGTAGC